MIHKPEPGFLLPDRRKGLGEEILGVGTSAVMRKYGRTRILNLAVDFGPG